MKHMFPRLSHGWRSSHSIACVWRVFEYCTHMWLWKVGNYSNHPTGTTESSVSALLPWPRTWWWFSKGLFARRRRRRAENIETFLQWNSIIIWPHFPHIFSPIVWFKEWTSVVRPCHVSVAWCSCWGRCTQRKCAAQIVLELASGNPRSKELAFPLSE